MIKKLKKSLIFLLIPIILIGVILWLNSSFSESLYRILVLKSEVIVGTARSHEYQNFSTAKLIHIIHDASISPAPPRGSWASMDRVNRRSAAFMVLGARTDELAIKEIEKIITQPMNSVRVEQDICEIISAIGRSKNKMAASGLCKLIKTHPKPRIMQLVISALLKIDYSEALPILKAERPSMNEEYCRYLADQAINRWELIGMGSKSSSNKN